MHLQTSSPNVRVRPPAPAADVMVTAATSTAAASFGQYLITKISPLVSKGNLFSLLTKLSGTPSKGVPGISASSALSGVTYFNGYLLSELGLQFGTSSKQDVSYYIPGTFLSASTENYIFMKSISFIFLCSVISYMMSIIFLSYLLIMLTGQQHIRTCSQWNVRGSEHESNIIHEHTEFLKRLWEYLNHQSKLPRPQW